MLDQARPQLRIKPDDVHGEIRIYKPCGHQHTPDDAGVSDIDDVGLVCVDGYEYSICHVCCTNGDGQGEECADGHTDCWPCRPLRSLAHRLSVTHHRAAVAMANGDTPVWTKHAREAAEMYRELVRHLPLPDAEQTGDHRG